MNRKSNTVASFGIIAALIIAAITIETAFSAGLDVNIAAISIAVVLIVCQATDFKTAIFAATTFGFVSFLRAFIVPKLTSPLFMNPLVSIVPRICVGLTTYFSLKLFKKLFKKYKNSVAKTIPFILSGGIGVITNTFIVVPMMIAFDSTKTISTLIAVIVGLNFTIEILTGTIVVPIASKTLLHVRRNVNYKDPVEQENSGDENNTET